MSQRSLVTINISETAEALGALRTQQTCRWNYLKVSMLYLFKTEEAKTFQQAAHLLGLSRATMSNWMQTYKQTGLNGLLKTPKSSPRPIPEWAFERLLEELRETQLLLTVGTVQSWLVTLGLRVGLTAAAQLLSSLKPRLQVIRQQGKGLDAEVEPEPKPTIEYLLLEPDICQPYEQWKQQRLLRSDTDALSQIMHEYFKLSSLSETHEPHTINSFEKEAGELCAAASHSPIDTPDLLTQDALAQRLEVNSSLLSRNRSKSTFTRWAKHHDPDGVGWQWIPSLRKYQALI